MFLSNFVSNLVQVFQPWKGDFCSTDCFELAMDNYGRHFFDESWERVSHAPHIWTCLKAVPSHCPHFFLRLQPMHDFGNAGCLAVVVTLHCMLSISTNSIRDGGRKAHRSEWRSSTPREIAKPSLLPKKPELRP